MKPIIKYSGGKSKEIPNILPHIPEFSGRYIEPFFGGGSLFFHLEPKNAIINDVNSKLFQFYQEVQENFPQVQQELATLEQLYRYNQAEFETAREENPEERILNGNDTLYYKMRDMYNQVAEPAYCYGAIYYFINKTAYSGMIRYNSKGQYNVPYGRYKNLNTSLLTEAHHELLKSASLYNLDYSEIFQMTSPDDFLFLDPPYDCAFSDYGNQSMKDGFGEERHRKLAEDLKNLDSKYLMVIGKTPLIEELYKDLIVEEYEKNYAVNIRNRFKAQSQHLVIKNF